jgi:hypothetical protein
MERRSVYRKAVCPDLFATLPNVFTFQTLLICANKC